MEYLIVALAVWFLWNVLLMFAVTPSWFPYVFATGLCIGGVCLIDPSRWWWGFGLVGLASAFMLVGDLVLIATDFLRSRLTR